LLEGLKLIGKDVLKILEEAGVKRMEVVGKKFDPFLHEAVEQVEMENVEDGTIIEEVMKGYMLDDKVLRPPKVKVARSKKV
jgi:molecular chaperone GrpE